jgi:outer membrane protein assembly factor BamB
MNMRYSRSFGLLMLFVSFLAVALLRTSTIDVPLGDAATLMAQSPTAPSNSDDQWPVYRGSALATGVAAAPLPEKLEVAWKFAEDLGPVEATPVSMDGVVFVGDVDGHFVALDLQNGKLKWRQKFETGFISSAAVNESLVVVGDYDGTIRALNKQDGSVKWEFTTNGEIDSGASFYKDLVLVTSQDGSLYALNADDGQVKWKYATGDQLRCSPTIVENRTFLGGCDAKLHVVNLDTGTAMGEPYALGNPTGSTPAVVGEIGYLSTYGGQILAFNWKDLSRKWIFFDNKLVPEFEVSVAATNDMIVGVGKNRKVLGINAQDGKLIWEAPLKKRADVAPVISDSRVWIAATDARLYAFDLKTGQEVWKYEFKGPLHSAPAIVSGRLVLGTDNEGIVCFAGQP